MPPVLKHPGVYIEELPSAVRAITGVPTSITGFVGRAWRGPLNEPVKVNSWADFERTFGGLWRASTLSYAVQQFFANGGSEAIVVRVTRDGGSSGATRATIDLGGGTRLEAANPGTWGRNLVVTIDHNTKDKDVPSPATPDTNLFNLTILDDPTVTADSGKRGGSGARETFFNVSRDPNSPREVTRVLAEGSRLVRASAVGGSRPAAAVKTASETSGGDGDAVIAADVNGGITELARADIVNLLCVPPLTPDTADNGIEVWRHASRFCRDKRAFLIMDAPRGWTVATALTGIVALRNNVERSYAAVYFPRIRATDPLRDGAVEDFAPSGAVAGVMSRTDAERGVWKAPAGLDAGLRGVVGFEVNQQPETLTDAENGDLNPQGINCLRALPGIGNVIWGARTVDGADLFASQWKYVPVRRLALYIEESLFRGTQWVVFEPNDEPLWAQIRLNVGRFMHDLFRQGAFQGTSPREAYLVKCDRETTTQSDIDRGVVNILVGFAPLKPAEFVVIRIQQLAGQSQA